MFTANQSYNYFTMNFSAFDKFVANQQTHTSSHMKYLKRAEALTAMINLKNTSYPEVRIEPYHIQHDPMKCAKESCHQQRFFLESRQEYLSTCSRKCARKGYFFDDIKTFDKFFNH